MPFPEGREILQNHILLFKKTFSKHSNLPATRLGKGSFLLLNSSGSKSDSVIVAYLTFQKKMGKIQVCPEPDCSRWQNNPGTSGFYAGVYGKRKEEW